MNGRVRSAPVATASSGFGTIVQGIVLLALSVAVLAIAAKTVIHLPGVPYNVKEVFGGEPKLITLVRFSSTLLSIGMGAHFAAVLASRSRVSALTLPLWCLAAVVVSFIIAQRSIAIESFDDFLGTENLYRDIVRNGAWGEQAARSLSHINEGLFIILERGVRFVCLITPLVFWLAVFDLCLARPAVDGLRKFAVLVVFAAPWLLLFKYVAFDLANTDNLVELIEPHNGFYLYGLLVLIAFVAALIASFPGFRTSGRLLIIVLVVAALPAGWFLANAGFVARLEKYNTVFSGLDFLLGPDREHKVARSVLFLRWSALQMAATLGLTWSMLIASKFARIQTQSKSSVAAGRS